MFCRFVRLDRKRKALVIWQQTVYFSMKTNFMLTLLRLQQLVMPEKRKKMNISLSGQKLRCSDILLTASQVGKYTQVIKRLQKRNGKFEADTF